MAVRAAGQAEDPATIVSSLMALVPVGDTSWCFDRWAKKVAKLPDDSPDSAWPPIDWVLFREGGLGGGVHTVRLGEAAAYPVGPGEGPWLFGTAGITV